jgi:hypothetical protein
MRLKTLVAVAVAAVFALPLSTQAQSDKPSSGTGASKDVPAKCAALTGADREKCLSEERGAGSGGSGSSTTSPTPPPTSPSTPGSGSSEPKKQ